MALTAGLAGLAAHDRSSDQGKSSATLARDNARPVSPMPTPPSIAPSGPPTAGITPTRRWCRRTRSWRGCWRSTWSGWGWCGASLEPEHRGKFSADENDHRSRTPQRPSTASVGILVTVWPRLGRASQTTTGLVSMRSMKRAYGRSTRMERVYAPSRFRAIAVHERCPRVRANKARGAPHCPAGEGPHSSKVLVACSTSATT